MSAFLNRRTRNRKKLKAGSELRHHVSGTISIIDSLDVDTSEQTELFDNLLATLDGNAFRPTEYCDPFKDHTIIILGGDVVQNAEVISELEPLGASIIEYADTDRLLVDVIQKDVKGTDPSKISAVIAMIDYWPGRRNLPDFSLKMKSLLPKCRTAVASRFEAQDNFTKVGTPPIDGTIRLPLMGCAVCRLTFQVYNRAHRH